jgi:hypothetical protein
MTIKSAEQTPLLLHSLGEFREFLELLLHVQQARSVVEVGGEYGIFTQRLVDKLRQGTIDRLHIVDPTPKPDLENLITSCKDLGNSLRLVRATSLEALPAIPLADCYLLDGDHNYYTVLHELAEIEKLAVQAGRQPLIVAHDVGWPCARRDMYYAAERIPAEWRHPNLVHQGVVMDSDAPVEGGFRSNGLFSWAIRNGGPNNGVLTAIEDFIADRPHLTLHIIPAVFGLAILGPKDSPAMNMLDGEAYPSALVSLLARMEDNRLHLYLKVLEQQDQLDSLRNEAEQLRARLQLIDDRRLSTRIRRWLAFFASGSGR